MSAGAAALDADQLRHLAASILSAPRYSEGPLPQPWAGPLRRVGHWLSHAFSSLEHGFPGGPSGFWLVAVVLVLAFVTFIMSRSSARLPLASGRAWSRGWLTESEDPRELEERAAAAALAGEFEQAVRLRFRAGLLSLDALGRIEYRSALRTAEVSRQLRSEEFDELAQRFERIAYGGATADATAADAARAGWQRVLTSAGR